MNTSPDKQPPLPKGKGFSRRFTIAIISALVGVVALIVIMIDVFSPAQYSNSTTSASNNNSDLAASNIDALDEQRVPILLLKGWTVTIQGKPYQVYQQGDKTLVKLDDHSMALRNGAVLYKDGQPYTYQDGHLVPLNAQTSEAQKIAHDELTGPQPGDIVEKNGKLYQVGADGKLHAYHGKLKTGQVVWKDGKPYVVGSDGKLHVMPTGYIRTINGKPYVYENGHFIPLSDEGAKPGDLVEKNGKLYQLGKDGQLHPYTGPLKAGQVVWKDGKPYIVNSKGQLVPVKDGMMRTINGKPYVYKNGKWVPLSQTGVKPGDLVEKNGKFYQLGKDGKLHPYAGQLKAGQVVWKDGKPYMVNSQGQLVPLKDGMMRTINGKPYVYKNGHWIPLSQTGVKPGDLVEKNGKLYQLGADGKLHAYHGALQPGQVVWKDGKAYRVNAQGQLVPVGQKTAGMAPIGSAATDRASDEAEKTALHSALIVFQDTKNTPKKNQASSNGNALQQNLAALDKQTNSLTQSLLQSQNEYASQNGQSQKTAFLQAAGSESTQPLKNQVQKASSPYTITAGTIIPAELITGINSDLPGQIIAQVSQNVYDTATGNYLLIPQGTRIIGSYDSSVTYGQARVLIAFNQLIFPNSDSYNLAGMPGADLSGYAGIHDKVNNHYMKIFGSALMFSVFGALGQLSQPKSSGQLGPTDQQIIYGAVGQQLTQTAAQMVAKNMNIQPTLSIRPGANFNILVTRNMVLPNPYRFSANQR